MVLAGRTQRHMHARYRCRRAFRRLAPGELSDLVRGFDRHARFDPSSLYNGLIRCLHPLSEHRLLRARTFPEERLRYDDVTTAEALASSDALLERLVDFAGRQEGGELPSLDGIDWPDLPAEPHLPELVAAADPELPPIAFLGAFDLALKGLFVSHATLIEHDDAWYATYARRLSDTAFLVLTQPDAELERELNEFFTLLFLVYPFTWLGDRIITCGPSSRKAYFADRFVQGNEGSPCAISPSSPRS